MQLWDRISKSHYHKLRALFTHTHTHTRLLNFSARFDKHPLSMDPNWNISPQFPNQFGNHKMSPFRLFRVFTLMFWMSFVSQVLNVKFQVSTKCFIWFLCSLSYVKLLVNIVWIKLFFKVIITIHLIAY
jgi:hypothetical protein